MARTHSNHLPEPCASCPVLGFTFYGLGPEDDVAEICHIRKGNEICLKGRTIYREGERGDKIYTLMDGWAFKYILLPNGRRQILNFILPGDPLLSALLHLKQLPYSIQALTNVSLCAFNLREMADVLAERPLLARGLDAKRASDFVNMSIRLTDVGRRTADERLAHFLLSLYWRLKEREYAIGQSVPFPLRLQHVADALGLTATHASRVLAELKRRGLISLSQSRLTILDESGLAAIAMVPSSAV